MKMDYKNFKVELKIKDDREYTDISLVVDRKDFFRDCINVRKQIGLSRPIPHDSPPNKHIRGEEFGKLMYLTAAMEDKYKVGLSTIRSAILHGEITELDLDMPPVFAGIIMSDENTVKVNKLKGVGLMTLSGRFGPMLGIIFSPEAQVKDFREYINKAWLDRVKEQYEILVGKDQLPIHTKSKIREHRKWYWKNVRGKSYAKIARENLGETSEDIPPVPVDEMDKVAKAIQAYKRLLTMPLAVHPYSKS